MDQPRRRNILRELSLVIHAVGSEVTATGLVEPALWLPGSKGLRPSVLAAWADIVLGFVATEALKPRLPTVLALDVELVHPLENIETVQVSGRIAKAGRSLAVCAVDFTDATGRRLGTGHGMLMAVPGSEVEQPRPGPPAEASWAQRRSLSEPFAASAGCTRASSGVAVLPCAPHVLNHVKSLNGGLLSLVVEEAALSANGPDASIVSMSLHFLRGIRGGPAIARAEVKGGGVTTVQVHDASTEALALTATLRTE